MVAMVRVLVINGQSRRRDGAPLDGRQFQVEHLVGRRGQRPSSPARRRWRSSAVRVANTLGLDVAGVDILLDDDG